MLSILQQEFNCLKESFFMTFGIHFSREAKERGALVVCALSHVSLFVLEMISTVC